MFEIYMGLPDMENFWNSLVASVEAGAAGKSEEKKMVYRVFVEKKKELAIEAERLLSDLRGFLGITALSGLRMANRYDVENIDPELFEYAKKTVFSEPQTDRVYESLEALVEAGAPSHIFAVEYLPGQFDQRADSAAQCIQLISTGERPTVRSAKLYLLYGELPPKEIDEIKRYVINPVEAREATMELPESLESEYETPPDVEILSGFRELEGSALEAFIAERGLAMDSGDLGFCRDYFRREGRDPSLTEIRLIDTYWSDHCRHTTFNTIIDGASFEDPLLESEWQKYLALRENLGIKKPVRLMDIGTIAAKELKSLGRLEKLDESEEINACTVKIDAEIDGKTEPWLLLFKNETHNHPTEIEPFGGAATCIGGAIRDPLSGRAYVYGAMRLSGASDPLQAVGDTLPGKLPQRKIVTEAAAGYSSYGNQIGLATGIVDELYHPGYAAKRMEIGAVIAAAPAENVRRERPAPGDAVILLGGGTGRDGIGGATGSSKAHDSHSVESCGAEVQKGNAPEERKLQRLFRNPKASRLIKRSNDFGAGGVSVAIGELADGLEIDLDRVPKKYEGLDGTELAISESQERMAVVVDEKDAPLFLSLAREENLNAVVVATVTAEPRLTMRWRGKTIVDLNREFLDSNGAEKHINVACEKAEISRGAIEASDSFSESMKRMAGDLNCCSKRGLSERFDSTIGAGTVLMPFGGLYQLTPAQAMVQKISVEKGHSESCSAMSWGFNPYISEKSPFHGAYLAVVESLCKLAATGVDTDETYLSFQEYFEKPGRDPKRWGKPLSALLGALRAQRELGIAAIGGKDSMSGSFENLDVPPTLVSFAVTCGKTGDILSPEFKRAGSEVLLLSPKYGEDGLPESSSLLSLLKYLRELNEKKALSACYTLGFGGAAEAVLKMSLGNAFGFCFSEELAAGGKDALSELFRCKYGSFAVELAPAFSASELLSDIAARGSFRALLLGTVTADEKYSFGDESVYASELSEIYENRLESVYSCNIASAEAPVKNFEYRAETYPAPAVKSARPKVLIPAFPGTNCEYDSAKAMRDAGAEPEIAVINNLDSEGIRLSIARFAAALKESQMVFIPGGFSGGDEPDGSGKFITAFFRNPEIKEEITALLDRRGGLVCGICNGFQALIKLGLVPYGKIIDASESSPTLSFNTIGRHQSKIVRTRVASNKSPWLSFAEVGEIYSVPISHGEGRFIASDGLVAELAKNGQIATQYVDLNGGASMDIRFNPNGSAFAVEGLSSPDGRVFGKMGHSERRGNGLYLNVPGNYDFKMFESAVKYFKG